MAVLASAEDWSGRVVELAGDQSYTLAELAAEIARQSGQPVRYTDLPEADYKAALIGAGLPEPVRDCWPTATSARRRAPCSTMVTSSAG